MVLKSSRVGRHGRGAPHLATEAEAEVMVVVTGGRHSSHHSSQEAENTG